VKRSLRITSFDPLDFRKLIPEPVKQKILHILGEFKSTKRGIKSERDFLDRYSLKDYFILETNVMDSLDLLVALKK
jgi:hypothetical protein